MSDVSNETGKPAVHHPIFARVYARISESGERRGGAEHRARLLAGVSGRVIEVGAGNGKNFRHYPSSVTEVVAVEPESTLRKLGEAEAETAVAPIRVVGGVAEQLPAEDESFDVGVVSLVLCSVGNQDRALGELRRVIRPGGELRFYEHVVSKKQIEARIQRALDATIYPYVSGNDHMSRDTGAAIERNGFAIESCERFRFSPAVWLPPDDHILGIARRP
jgi:ubiquinone/menaquinone biosynthesis C-methylase UbiE